MPSWGPCRPQALFPVHGHIIFKDSYLLVHFQAGSAVNYVTEQNTQLQASRAPRKETEARMQMKQMFWMLSESTPLSSLWLKEK